MDLYEETDMGDNVRKRLQAIVQRIENVEGEIEGFQEDRKEIYAEAKSAGFDVKVLKQIIKRRKKDRDAVDQEDTMIQVYEDALKEFKEMMG